MIRIVSYNLLRGRALDEVEPLLSGADALCLQETDERSLPNELGGLRLANATRGGRLGLAIYLDLDRFSVLDTSAFELKKALHDRVFDPGPERLLGVRVADAAHDQEFVLASFHAAPLSSPNSLRRKQIKASHALLSELGEGAPVLMAGDYNYPLFHSRLAKRVEKRGFDLVLSDKRTYSAYKIFHGHFDFVTSQGMEIDRVETLPRGRSDHRPILITADYRQVLTAAS